MNATRSRFISVIAMVAISGASVLRAGVGVSGRDVQTRRLSGSRPRGPIRFTPYTGSRKSQGEAGAAG